MQVSAIRPGLAARNQMAGYRVVARKDGERVTDYAN
jgi:hypothetical protein